MKPLQALVVDDNCINQELLTFVLEESNFAVVCTNQPKKALDIGRRQPIDLVLLDVQLPGMNGFVLASEIRKQHWGDAVCIVLVTSYAMAADREKAFAAGCDGYVSKPIDTRTFVPRIMEFLRLRGRAVA